MTDLRIRWQKRDYGHATMFSIRRGAQRQAVNVRGRRVTPSKRAAARRMLKRWMATARTGRMVRS